ncbi:hypothetical protein [Candidatus Coxiella mudrowiae]|uniref:hypothetical protein n=1 Tax=Candidatus Coxiella mudrowiae TaxID=2054173 RepID=UPI001F37EF5F|nr:hypothetical protein [Candidatus Coxiella mudrowiae]
MTLPTAREFSKYGIRVMAIAPGVIATPMMENMLNEVQESFSCVCSISSSFWPSG